MAPIPLSARDLAMTPTVFSSFMGCAGPGRRTVGELLGIYRRRSATLDAVEDRDDDLRVNRFARDMASERWRSDLVMRVGVFDGEVLVIDGIHRGIAYLACVEDGVGAERLPALHVDC